jgi:hypothetical protein
VARYITGLGPVHSDYDRHWKRYLALTKKQDPDFWLHREHLNSLQLLKTDLRRNGKERVSGPVQESHRQHGTRAKYVWDRCRCFACKVANANYVTDCAARRRARAPWRVRYVPECGEWYCQNQLTGDQDFRTPDQVEAYEHVEALNTIWALDCDTPPLWADASLVRQVRRHLELLRKCGISLRALSLGIPMSRTRLQEILHGRGMHKDRPKRPALKHATAEKILDVLPGPALIPHGAQIAAAETWRLIDELRAAGMTKGDIALDLGAARPALQIRSDRVLKSTYLRVKELHDLAWRVSSKLRAVCSCQDIGSPRTLSKNAPPPRPGAPAAAARPIS